MKQNKTKLLLIGLDGGNFDVLHQLVHQGKLPNIANCMERGSWGFLKSVLHPITYPAWSSFITGKTPGNHGIFNFYKPTNDYGVRFLTAAQRRGTSLWKILGNNGKKVGIFNMPVTYPPEKVNGFLISGLGTPGKHSNFTYPENLRSELVGKFGEYSILDIDPGGRTKEQFVSHLEKVTSDTIEIAKYLLKKYNVDLFSVVFSTTDIAQHFFWHCMDPAHPLFTKKENEKYGDVVFKIYEQIDNGIGELIDCFSERPTVMVMSDHGAGHTKKTINLNYWLRENNYLKLKSNKNVVLQKFLSVMRKEVGLALSVEWKSKIDRLIPKIRKKIDSHLFFSNIDFKNTKAFLAGPIPYIYINKKARWAQGIVGDGREYKNTVKEIKGKLLNLRDPDSGKRIIEEIYTKEERYKDEYSDNAPDLILQMKDYAYETSSGFESWHGPLFKNISNDYRNSKPVRLSGHRIEGIIIVDGEDIENKTINGAEIIDLAPTILHLMGLSIPKDMDGRVLDIFRPAYLKENPVRYGVGFSDDNGKALDDHDDYKNFEAEEIKERLHELGYL